MKKINSLAVFCGSSPGKDQELHQTLRRLCQQFAKENIRLVYGGASIGLMGIMADEWIDSGGEVFGVIPQFLQLKELAHPRLHRLEIVTTMHQRKEKMYELSDAFLILPGGFGTLDEFFEILTWKQLAHHQKPIAVFNWKGYFDGLKVFTERAQAEGFIQGRDQTLFEWLSSEDELSAFCLKK